MVVRMRHTKSQRNQRRAHHALKKKAFSLCGNCKTETLPHAVCVNCGYYNGKQVVDVLAKSKKRDLKNKKQEKEHKQEA